MDLPHLSPPPPAPCPRGASLSPIRRSNTLVAAAPLARAAWQFVFLLRAACQSDAQLRSGVPRQSLLRATLSRTTLYNASLHFPRKFCAASRARTICYGRFGPVSPQLLAALLYALLTLPRHSPSCAAPLSPPAPLSLVGAARARTRASTLHSEPSTSCERFM
eukprot:1495063-Pleurochrysis_carterae.AAC.5